MRMGKRKQHLLKHQRNDWPDGDADDDDDSKQNILFIMKLSIFILQKKLRIILIISCSKHFFMLGLMISSLDQKNYFEKTWRFDWLQNIFMFNFIMKSQPSPNKLIHRPLLAIFFFNLSSPRDVEYLQCFPTFFLNLIILMKLIWIEFDYHPWHDNKAECKFIISSISWLFRLIFILTQLNSSAPLPSYSILKRNAFFTA